MTISNPVSATYIFTALLLGACLLTMRSRTPNTFSTDVVQELKGFAILAIVLSHVGYFLFSDHRFLSPLSGIAGVGVDLFLLVSGFGLAASAFKSLRKPFDFYRRRMDKLFVPLWVSLAVFFTLDFFVLGKAYAFDYIVRSFLGFFPNADVFADLNSPLWYITLILFYYLLFPLLFSPKRPVVSVGAFLTVSYAVLWLNPQFFSNVRHLYELHVWAFPAGVLLAAVLRDKSIVKISSPPIYWATLAALTVAIGYFALNGNVGAGVYLEQVTSILTALLFCTFFVIKKFEVRLLYLFGMFSYEIYLLHWPIMSRYDIFFRFLPPWLALSMYFALFLGLGWCLQAGIKKLSAR